MWKILNVVTGEYLVCRDKYTRKIKQFHTKASAYFYIKHTFFVNQQVYFEPVFYVENT